MKTRRQSLMAEEDRILAKRLPYPEKSPGGKGPLGTSRDQASPCVRDVGLLGFNI